MFAKFNVIMLAGAVFAAFCFVNSASADGGQSQPADDGQLFSIEGKILPPSAPVPPQGASAASQSPPPLPFAMETTEIVVNGRKRVGFVRPDGSFSIPGLPAGSHLVEVACPNYFFEPVKVDISSKGKFRARKVNLVQPSQVVQVSNRFPSSTISYIFEPFLNCDCFSAVKQGLMSEEEAEIGNVYAGV
jgi:hypothetical protein